MAGQKGNTNKTIDAEALTKFVGIRFSENELKEIEEIAKNLEIPKARLIRNMTLAGLEDAKILNKIGLLKGAKKIIDFKERYRHPEKYRTLQTE
jgi:hypothetical protein